MCSVTPTIMNHLHRAEELQRFLLACDAHERLRISKIAKKHRYDALGGQMYQQNSIISKHFKIVLLELDQWMLKNNMTATKHLDKLTQVKKDLYSIVNYNKHLSLLLGPNQFMASLDLHIRNIEGILMSTVKPCLTGFRKYIDGNVDGSYTVEDQELLPSVIQFYMHQLKTIRSYTVADEKLEDIFAKGFAIAIDAKKVHQTHLQIVFDALYPAILDKTSSEEMTNLLQDFELGFCNKLKKLSFILENDETKAFNYALSTIYSSADNAVLDLTNKELMRVLDYHDRLYFEKSGNLSQNEPRNRRKFEELMQQYPDRYRMNFQGVWTLRMKENQ